MKTIVIGAVPKPERFSYKAVVLLKRYEHEVIPIGIRKGQISGSEILTGKPYVNDVHTISLYIGIQNQPEYYDYIFSLNPKRLIFNPGTENSKLSFMAKEKHIETINNCTLVMLNSGVF